MGQEKQSVKTSHRTKTLFCTLLSVSLAVLVGLTSATWQPIRATAAAAVSTSASFEYAPEANSPSPELTIVIEVNVANGADRKHYGLQIWVTEPATNRDWSFSKVLTSCNNLANPTVSELAACDIEITRTRAGVTEPLQLNGISYGLTCCLNLGTAVDYTETTNRVLINDVYTIKLARGAFTTSGVGSSYVVNSYVMGYDLDGSNFGIPGQSPTFEVVPAGTREQQIRDSARRVVSVSHVNPTTVSTRRQIITIDGTNLDTVTEILIDGIKSKVVAQKSNQLRVRAPRGPIGVVDLELKSPVNDVFLAKKLNYGSPPFSKREEGVIIRDFILDSSELSPIMERKIKIWLSRFPELRTLQCTGFTSLPRLASDVVLSTKRGRVACNFAKLQRPELKTEVSQGIEDPRPGSNIRRVRLVLKP